ncbi:unannotated protein [freshwater metagenome]|uniref:Unannotated protein n=1 Tax=freshwater metagenome TaxID=449393 RepID=A0A6J7FQF9_9ZZZZ
MRLDELGNLGNGCFPVHGQIAAAELLGHPRAHHVHAEHLTGGAIRVLLGYHLHQSVDVADDLGAAVGTELMLAHHDLVPRSDGRLLAETGPRHLGVAVDGPRDAVVADRHGALAQDMLHDQDRLGVADVRQLRRVDEVADGVDARLAGATELVDFDETTVAHAYTGAGEAELISEGTAADRHDDGIDLEVFVLTEVHRGAAPAIGGLLGRVTAHRHAGADIDVLLLEAAHHHVGEVGVKTRKHLGQAFEDGHRGAEIGKGGCELAPDGPTADDSDTCWHVIEHEHFVAGHDRPTTIEAGNGSGYRTRSQHHGAALRLHGATIGQGNGDRAIGAQRTDAEVVGDLAALDQPADALDETVDDLLLTCLCDSEVDRRRTGLDAELGRMGHMTVHGCCLEEGFRRDAAAVQARTTDDIFLDEGNREPSRRGIQRRSVATGATTDDDQIELLGQTDHLQHLPANGEMRPPP